MATHHGWFRRWRRWIIQGAVLVVVLAIIAYAVFRLVPHPSSPNTASSQATSSATATTSPALTPSAGTTTAAATLTPAATTSTAMASPTPTATATEVTPSPTPVVSASSLAPVSAHGINLDAACAWVYPGTTAVPDSSGSSAVAQCAPGDGFLAMSDLLRWCQNRYGSAWQPENDRSNPSVFACIKQ